MKSHNGVIIKPGSQSWILKILFCHKTPNNSIFMAKNFISKILRMQIFLNFQIPSSDSSSQHCFACARIFEASRDINLYECPDCSQIFCCDCDIFIHEALHSCPGCSSTPQLAAVNQTQPTAGTGVTNTNGNHHFNGIL